MNNKITPDTNLNKEETLLNKTRAQDFSDFLEKLSYIYSFDRDAFFNLVQSAIKYYRGCKTDRDSLRTIQDLENAWYESLDRGNPNYGIYNKLELLPD